MSEQNWRTEVTGADYFLHRQKEGNLSDRRPVIRKPSDLVGPGIAAQAVRIADFNDPLATFNGFFSAAAGALNAPNADEVFVGTVVGDAEFGGVQRFTGLTSGTDFKRMFRRRPNDPSYITWTVWS